MVELAYGQVDFPIPTPVTLDFASPITAMSDIRGTV